MLDGSSFYRETMGDDFVDSHRRPQALGGRPLPDGGRAGSPTTPSPGSRTGSTVSTSAPSDVAALVTEQRAEIRRLRRHIERLEAVVAEARQATLWDFTVYEQLPDPTWVAIDRETAGRLLLSLEDVDDWRPWRSTIERRPS